MSNVGTIEEGLEQYLANPLFYAVLMGTFSLIALTIAAVGVFGVTSYLVSQRTREFGIRMALGATPTHIMWGVLRQGLTLIVPGVTGGLIGALALTRYLEGLLFELTPLDPATFLSAAGLLAIVAIVALYLPARRAMKVDPLVAVRDA